MFQNKTQSHSIFLFYCYNVYFFIGIVILCMFCCIVLSIISIFYYSIYVIFSYSAFRLQKCSIKINQSISQSVKLEGNTFSIASFPSHRP